MTQAGRPVAQVDVRVRWRRARRIEGYCSAILANFVPLGGTLKAKGRDCDRASSLIRGQFLTSC